MVEPPSLPYARDEASTSHQAFAFPSYTDTFDEEEEAEGSVEDDANAAPQYWAAKRHKSGKGKAKYDEEHSEWTAHSAMSEEALSYRLRTIC